MVKEHLLEHETSSKNPDISNSSSLCEIGVEHIRGVGVGFNWVLHNTDKNQWQLLVKQDIQAQLWWKQNYFCSNFQGLAYKPQTEDKVAYNHISNNKH